jgi:hypothetical protein
MRAPPQAIAPNPHTNLLNVMQIANKMGFQQKKSYFVHFSLGNYRTAVGDVGSVPGEGIYCLFY